MYYILYIYYIILFHVLLLRSRAHGGNSSAPPPPYNWPNSVADTTRVCSCFSRLILITTPCRHATRRSYYDNDYAHYSITFIYSLISVPVAVNVVVCLSAFMAAPGRRRY